MKTPAFSGQPPDNQFERSLLAWMFRKWTDLLLFLAAVHLMAYITLPWTRDERISYAAFFFYSATLLVWRVKARLESTPIDAAKAE